jgi:hypothetical protein
MATSKHKPKGGSKKSRTPQAAAKSPRKSPVHSQSGPDGAGEFYHVEVQPRAKFRAFRTQDVGKSGGIERVAGQLSTGSWDTQKWLIGKKLAQVVKQRLVATSNEAERVLRTLESEPKRIAGDHFKARLRAAQKRSRRARAQKASQRQQAKSRRSRQSS